MFLELYSLYLVFSPKMHFSARKCIFQPENACFSPKMHFSIRNAFLNEWMKKWKKWCSGDRDCATCKEQPVRYRIWTVWQISSHKDIENMKRYIENTIYYHVCYSIRVVVSCEAVMPRIIYLSQHQFSLCAFRVTLHPSCILKWQCGTSGAVQAQPP